MRRNAPPPVAADRANRVVRRGTMIRSKSKLEERALLLWSTRSSSSAISDAIRKSARHRPGNRSPTSAWRPTASGAIATATARSRRSGTTSSSGATGRGRFAVPHEGSPDLHRGTVADAVLGRSAVRSEAIPHRGDLRELPDARSAQRFRRPHGRCTGTRGPRLRIRLRTTTTSLSRAQRTRPQWSCETARTVKPAERTPDRVPACLP